MTYIAGWQRRECVYLLADMALTGVPKMSERTSFGELRARFDGGNVEEAALKLVAIAPGTALAYAGDVGLAHSIAKFIRNSLAPSATPAEIFRAVETSMGPFDNTRPVELLLAQGSADRSATLTHWSTTKGSNSAATDFADAGSLDSSLKKRTRRIIQRFAEEQDVDDESLLARATSAVQLYGRHDNLPAQGVGGLICGLRVCAGQTIWQADTVFVMYKAIGSAIGSHPVQVIMAGVRNDVVIIYSSFTRACRYFGLHFLTDKPWAKWWEDVLARLTAWS